MNPICGFISVVLGEHTGKIFPDQSSQKQGRSTPFVFLAGGTRGKWSRNKTLFGIHRVLGRSTVREQTESRRKHTGCVEL